MRSFALSLILVLLVAGQLSAAYSLAEVVQASALRSVRVAYRDAGRKKSKVVYCLGRVGGDTRAATGGVLFTSYTVTVAALKAKRIRGARLKSAVALSKAAAAACKKFPALPTPTPTPSSAGNFDSQGNVTAAGKSLFGIPSLLSGNVAAGKSIALSYCSCHDLPLGKPYNYLRDQIVRPPMSFTSELFPDDMLANLTAYLNRFR